MSTIKTDTLQNVAASKSIGVGNLIDGAAKAWVNFNGTGTPAIRKSFNVSSITDNGVGDYTINFSVALPDANYVMLGMADGGTTSGGGFVSLNLAGTTTGQAIRTTDTTVGSPSNNVVSDVSQVHVAFLD